MHFPELTASLGCTVNEGIGIRTVKHFTPTLPARLLLVSPFKLSPLVSKFKNALDVSSELMKALIGSTLAISTGNTSLLKEVSVSSIVIEFGVLVELLLWDSSGSLRRPLRPSHW